MTAQNPVKEDLGVWLPLFETYEISTLPHDLVVRGLLRDDLDSASPEVAEALAGWTGSAHVHHDGTATEVVLVVPEEDGRTRPWVHAILFLATIFTTMGAGAMLEGLDPFRTGVLEVGRIFVPYPRALHLERLASGLPFALPLLGVLLAHEMGHYAAARHHRIRATLPYFIPFPPYLSLIGTMGAFIQLRGATIRRSHLLDVGAAGPILGFIAAIPLLALGLTWSVPLPGNAGLLTPFVVQFAGQPIWLGNGPLVHLMAQVFAPGTVGVEPLLLHPVAFAGWLGLFVTALNLLPMGQLDGGHVLYALLGPRQARVARLAYFTLIPLGLLWWGWWAWAAVVAFLHRGRAGHPRVVQPQAPVGRGRRILAWAVVALFFLTFVPVPLHL